MTQEFVSQEAPKYDVDKHHNQQVIMLQKSDSFYLTVMTTFPFLCPLST